MRASLIIPTLNEEEAITKVLKDIPRDVIDEVIVIDSSSDATAKIAESFGAKVVFERMKGYGRALQSGIEKAGGDIIIYMDGDYTYDPKDIRKIIEPILSDTSDVVLGNRLNRMMHPEAMNLLNKLGNTLISLIFSVVFLRRASDTQCGLRAIRKKFLESFSYRHYGMQYVTEQLIKLVMKGARIENIPVTYRPRIGTTKLCAWTDGFKILKVIIKGRLLK